MAADVAYGTCGRSATQCKGSHVARVHSPSLHTTSPVFAKPGRHATLQDALSLAPAHTDRSTLCDMFGARRQATGAQRTARGSNSPLAQTSGPDGTKPCSHLKAHVWPSRVPLH